MLCFAVAASNPNSIISSLSVSGSKMLCFISLKKRISLPLADPLHKIKWGKKKLLRKQCIKHFNWTYFVLVFGLRKREVVSEIERERKQ